MHKGPLRFIKITLTFYFVLVKDVLHNKHMKESVTTAPLRIQEMKL
jgi:hypothetical protein